MREGLRAKLWKVMGGFLLLLLGLVGLLLYSAGTELTGEQQRGEALVRLNEIRQLGKNADGFNPAEEQIDSLQEWIREESGAGQSRLVKKLLLTFLIFGALYLFTLFGCVYWKILKPFERLEEYAERIAGGDLEVSLGYERTNYFGAFTWAFDHMREEIRYARKREREAIEENKTVIASLSHDIKTPIASIRACSEALEANLNADYEKRQRYTGILMKKCDELTALVNDLVLHSLSELEKLEIRTGRLAIAGVIRSTVAEIAFDGVTLEEPLPEEWVNGGAVLGVISSALLTDLLVGRVFAMFGVNGFASHPDMIRMIIPGVIVAGVFFGCAYLVSAKIKKADAGVLIAE